MEGKKKITDFDPLIQKNNVTDTLIDKDDIFFFKFTFR